MIESVDQLPKMDFQIPAPGAGKSYETAAENVCRMSKAEEPRFEKADAPGGTFAIVRIRGHIVDRMRPGIREQRLQAVPEAMSELGLKGLIA